METITSRRKSRDVGHVQLRRSRQLFCGDFRAPCIRDWPGYPTHKEVSCREIVKYFQKIYLHSKVSGRSCRSWVPEMMKVT